MKKVTLIITGVLLAINMLIGMIVSTYSWHNVIMVSLCILFTSAIIIWICNARIADGFKYSLAILTPLFGIVEIAMASFMPCCIKDNWILVTLLVIVTIEIAALVLIASISGKHSN